MKIETPIIQDRISIRSSEDCGLLKKVPPALCVLFAAMTLGGCATDPVAQLLKTNGGFALVRPPSDGERLGDVHRKKNLLEKSIAMKDVMTSADLQAMMASRAEQADIPSTSGTKTFSLTGEAAYVGIATADFEAKGARKYRVAVSKPVIYDSPFDSHLSAVLIPAIKGKFPNVALQGKFIVRSLLEVGGLEYEFLREDGGKINIAADKQLIANLSAKLGTEWNVTKDSKLTITQPRFIGYRLARVDKDEEPGSAAPGAPLPPQAGVKLSKVPIGEHEDRDLRKRKKESKR